MYKSYLFVSLLLHWDVSLGHISRVQMKLRITPWCLIHLHTNQWHSIPPAAWGFSLNAYSSGCSQINIWVLNHWNNHPWPSAIPLSHYSMTYSSWIHFQTIWLGWGLTCIGFHERSGLWSWWWGLHDMRHLYQGHQPSAMWQWLCSHNVVSEPRVTDSHSVRNTFIVKNLISSSI